jgi:hypothetical protein
MTSHKSPSLIVYLDQKIVFQSDDKWLYPLFALEDFLVDQLINMEQAVVHDKVVGKAAAMLMTRLKTGRVHGELMSVLASKYLKKVGIPHSYDQMVDRIDCQTESILLDVEESDEAYQILCKRAKRC